MNSEISVIVVAHNEEANIRQCLDSLLQQTFQPLEIIVVDGCSTDQTPAICQTYAQRNRSIRYVRVDDTAQSIAKNRNEGLRQARGTLLAFTDADCQVPADWLQRLADGIERYRDQQVAAVGGANVAPPNGNRTMKAISLVQSSAFGFVGSAQGAVFRQDRIVPSLSCTNVLYQRSAVLQVGGFNEALGNIGEDYELAFRLRRAGFRLVFLAESYVWHKLRQSLGAFAKNMFTYGQGRMKLFRVTREYSAKYFVPLLFIAVIAISIIATPWYPLLAVVYAGYLAVITVYSIALSRSAPALLPRVVGVFLILHFCFAFGETTYFFQQLAPSGHGK